MSETRTLICIGCPMGCPMTVTLEGGQVSAVSGNTCKRGDAYARREVTAPTRVLTTTVGVSGGAAPVVPVRTRGEVPKARLMDCVRALRDLTVPAPVAAGQVLLPDLCGTGAALVAVADVDIM